MYHFNNKYSEFIVENLVENEHFYNIRFPWVPASGWKIHISCIMSNYNSLLDIVSEYCVENKISFKVMKNIDSYFKNGLKKGDRSSYGKFITIYPKDEEKFILVIEELYKAIKNFEGPYILSDKRYKDCKCIYYRYGNNLLDDTYDNKGVACRVVKYKNYDYLDLPTGYYNAPDFIEDPFDSPSSPDTSSYLLINYDIEEGLSFSPIGGVYKASSKKNQSACIVKEFYPYTGIVNENIDSFSLYENEVSNLQKLQKLKFIPRFIENFQDWDNFYLVEEYIEGKSLESYAAENNTVVLGLEFGEVRNYIIKTLKLFLKIIDNIIELYHYGYIFTDLAPDNIIINRNGVYFIDLESVHKIDSEKNLFSYTLNFYDKNKTDCENIKLSISNLLLFCFNKKSNLFDVFNADQILEPIIRRYDEVNKILQLINRIKNPESSILDIKQFFIETLEEITSFSNSKKLGQKTVNSLNTNYKYSILPKQLTYNGYIEDPIQNKNSIAYGTLGQLLAANYIFDEKFEKGVFSRYISDYRTNSFFYGHSGLLYILNLNRVKCDEVLFKILESIDFSDKSLQTGISGIGISLLYSYSIYYDEDTKSAIEKIRVNLAQPDIETIDNSLDNGKLGVALFYIYHYHIFKDHDSLLKATEYLNNVLSEFQDSKYKKLLAKSLNNEFYEYYLSNGLCGLIVVMLEFTIKTNNNIYFCDLEYFVKLCQGIYSISPSFFRGSASFLYTFFRVYKNLKLNESFEAEVTKQIEQFYLDIINTNSNDKFYDVKFENHERSFLGGKEGILTILDMVNKDTDSKKIFPFIL